MERNQRKWLNVGTSFNCIYHQRNVE